MPHDGKAEMNICYLIRSFSTQAGTESYVHNMSIALARLGHNVHIVSLTGKGQRDLKGFEDRISIHQFSLREDPFSGFLRLESIFPLSTWRYSRRMKEVLPAIVKDHAIDIIEATDWGVDAGHYLPERQVPVCVRLHGYPGFKAEFDGGILKRWPRNYFYWTSKRKHILSADLVTGVSQSYTDFVREAWEIKGKEVQIIPIAVDSNLFHPSGASREEQLILFAGRLEKSKGIEILAHAIALVLRKMPKARFCFAGKDQEYDDRHRSWSQRLMDYFSTEHVIYLGSLSTQELIRYYQTATICAVPSLYEPGGTVVFEAMACGCPVLASRAGGLGEVIKDRQSGLLIPPGDVEALADGLVELLQNDQLRQEISQRAVESIRADFDINVIARQTVDAYAGAIAAFKADESPRHKP
ncbi:MAG: glycosyltransferase family 4 protein [Elusimicrobia bacterium]|nr:glycosyltransferase family 4 protein [Elusimicrobiota bacterium]